MRGGEAEEEERIHEAIGMVQNEEGRALRGNVFRARDLDSPEEDAQDQAHRRGGKAPDHC